MQAHCHDVLYLALAFDITIGLKYGSIPRGIPATVVNVRSDNQIHDACFILQRFNTIPLAVPGRWRIMTTPATGLSTAGRLVDKLIFMGNPAPLNWTPRVWLGV